MSIWRRAVRVARSNLSDLAQRAASIGQRRSLEEMSDAELEAELERRRREHATRAAVDKARAKAEERRAEGRASSIPDDVAAPGFLADLSPQKRRELRQYYANLELPFGAPLDDVKHAYRRLMRQYHPDKFPDDPARKQLATKLSQKLTKAYNELSHLLRDYDSTRT